MSKRICSQQLHISVTEHRYTPTEKLPTQLSCRIQCDLPTVSSQELPRATVQAIKTLRQERAQAYLGFEGCLRLTEVIYTCAHTRTYRKTNAGLFLLLQGCSKASK